MQKGLRRLAVYLVGFSVLGAVSGFVAYKALSLTRTVEVPLLRGANLTGAKEMLRERGLSLKVEGEDYDPVEPEGNVIRQSIPDGMRIRGFRTISVTVSKGPVTLLMPSVLGLALAEAASVIEGNDLAVTRVIYVYSDSVEKDRVIAQSPAPKERTGQEITLIASSGPYDVIYYCPTFIGMLRDMALQLSERLGLEAELVGEGGSVVGQRPEANTEIRPGGKIVLLMGE